MGIFDSQGVQPNDFVAVMLPRVKEFMTTVFGIWKAGAAYVPIDPEYPEERRNFMIGDCDAKVVITKDVLGEVFQSSTIQHSAINKATPECLAYMKRRGYKSSCPC